LRIVAGIQSIRRGVACSTDRSSKSALRRRDLFGGRGAACDSSARRRRRNRPRKEPRLRGGDRESISRDTRVRNLDGRGGFARALPSAFRIPRGTTMKTRFASLLSAACFVATLVLSTPALDAQGAPKAPTAGGETREVRKDRHALKRDRRDLKRDRVDQRRDRRDLRHDKKELRRDRRDPDTRRGELRHDRRELKGDRRELHGDKRELKGDRRELRHDRRHHRRGKV
jgi:hypothetical protein